MTSSIWPKILVIIVLIVSLYFGVSFKKQTKNAPIIFDSTDKVNEQLRNHTSEFIKEEIIKVIDGVYVGVGYGLANSIILETEKSLVVVDVLDSKQSGLLFRKDFNSQVDSSISSKPISHVIYTHYHPDHIFGVDAFIDDHDNPPIIVSHPLTTSEIQSLLSVAGEIIHMRSTRQFGTKLSEKKSGQQCGEHEYDHLFENSGIGPFLRHGDRFDRSLVYPTLLLNDSFTEMIINGLKLHIYYAPGETNDQIAIYLPDKKVLLPADNIYRSFPNLYAIRGTTTRDARQWIQTLDNMKKLKPIPQYLVPCHTKPITAREDNPNEILDLITAYRDGVSYVHDQTVRFMNKGYHPDEIVYLVRNNMPLHLKNHPFLQEFYGTIDWSVRGIFQGYLGWFSGDVSDLYPLSKSNHGQRLISLLNNNIDLILTDINRVLSLDTNQQTRDDCQWALELSTYIIKSFLFDNTIGNTKNKDISITSDQLKLTKQYYGNAMQCMAKYMISANGRNYYLTSLLEENKEIIVGPTLKDRMWVLTEMPIQNIFEMLTVRLKYEKDLHNFYINIAWYMPSDDHHNIYYLYIRDGAVEFDHENIVDKDVDSIHQYIINNDNIDLAVQINEQDFRDLLTNEVGGAKLYAFGDLKILKGTVLTLGKFTNWFET